VNINQAVILCGGRGKRLNYLTKKIPKPLLKINGIPFIEYLIKNLSRYGVKEIILLCGYLGEKFIIKYHNKFFFGIKLFCIKENKPLATGGAIINAYKNLDKVFYLLNGDTYFDVNLNLLSLRFLPKKYDMLMCCAELKKNNSRYSKVDVKNSTIKLISYNTKKNYINAGLYIFKKKIFNKKIHYTSLENSIIPSLISKKKAQGFVVKKAQNIFIDIGIPKDFIRLPSFLKKNLKKPAIFFDRDGTINKDLKYVYQKNKIVWNKTVFEAIRKLNQNCYVFVITNQSGIGRGFYTEKNVVSLHNWMNIQLRKKGAHIDEFFYAPYYKFSKNVKYRKKKDLRKPNTGMIQQVMNLWNIDKKKCFVVGDSDNDILLAKKLKFFYFKVKFNDDLKKISSQILKRI
jgi:D-glycero-D-manno-heptose 1,7-bisphosphate phosphatase